MKRRWDWCLVLIAILFSTPVASQSLLAGKSVWESHCSGCHGELGTSDLSGVPNLAEAKAPIISFDERLTIISKGAGLMPPFGAVLSRREMEYAAAYMGTLYPETLSAFLIFPDPSLAGP